MLSKEGTSWVLYRLVSDQLGSMKLVVRVSDGWVAESYAGMYTSEWGYLGVQPAKQPFGFAGGLWDHTMGLYRFGARDYNPSQGKWWSKDPIRFGGGLNLYEYCNDDPVNYVDRDGRGPEALLGLVAPAMTVAEAAAWTGVAAIVLDCAAENCAGVKKVADHIFQKPQGDPLPPATLCRENNGDNGGDDPPSDEPDYRNLNVCFQVCAMVHKFDLVSYAHCVVTCINRYMGG